MDKLELDIFTYTEVLNDKAQELIPDVLKFRNPSKEAILFRLLLGTINIEHNFSNNVVRQRVNYSYLGTQKVKKISAKAVKNCEVPIADDITSFNKYMRRNRCNNPIFDNVLFEVSNFFYQKERESHLSGFVHLYRSIEQISYSFPLVYTSNSSDYTGTYRDLKNFFSDKQKSELKFFRVFQKTIIEEEILDLELDLIFDAPNQDMIDEFNKILTDVGNRFLVGNNQNYTTVKYGDFFELIIEVRNRYFHMLTGTNQRNISSKKIVVDYFFKSFNEYVLNWISYIYFRITRCGVEQV